MSKKKFLLMFTMVTALVAPLAVMANSTQIQALLAPQVKINVEGKQLDLGKSPAIQYQDQSYVSVPQLAEELGYQAAWNAATQTYQLTKKNDALPSILDTDSKFISVQPNYELMTSLDKSAYLGGIKLNFVYEITNDLPREPVLVVETLNKDKTVLASKTQLLKKTKGVHEGYTLPEYIRLPYPVSTSREEVIKQMNNDYTYRITVR
ncbi:stalk domain-containing protein [Brevibacillus panacihumi]|uniref:stalk domain-containing protein n=1 Tax=Brevibacillus panacihumi TaxID=497735 RepID=UPI003D08EEBE